MNVRPLMTCLVAASLFSSGCSRDRKKVDDANEAARSWAATVKVVTEQWAQSNVSLRFVRTTVNTAIGDLYRQAETIRAIDPVSARRIDRLKNAIEPVRAYVALNEPDRARDKAKDLTTIVEPEPVAPSARP